MTKNELIARVAENAGMTKNVVEKAYYSIFNEIASAFVDGEKVAVPGFGIFEVKERAARTGRNPRTGEAIQIAASKYVGFKTSKILKDLING